MIVTSTITRCLHQLLRINQSQGKSQCAIEEGSGFALSKLSGYFASSQNEFDSMMSVDLTLEERTAELFPLIEIDSIRSKQAYYCNCIILLLVLSTSIFFLIAYCAVRNATYYSNSTVSNNDVNSAYSKLI